MNAKQKRNRTFFIRIKIKGVNNAAKIVIFSIAQCGENKNGANFRLSRFPDDFLGRLLFGGHNLDIEGDFELLVEVDLSGVVAQFFDVVVAEGDLAAVDFDFVLSHEGLGDVGIGDGTEDGALVRGLGGNLDGKAFDFAGHEFGFFTELFGFESTLFDGFGQHFLVSGRSRNG